jgi:hypothetical protein
MRKHFTNIIFVALLLLIGKIGQTNSFFTSQVTVSGNTFSTSCWTLPSTVSLISPSDNYFTKNSTLNFTWNSANSSCSIATLSYQFQLASDPLFSPSSIIISSNWSSNLSYNYNFLSEGQYYWRVLVKDQFSNQSTSSLRTLTYDKTLPTSAITYPFNSNGDNIVQYTYLWNGKVTGTAADTLSGVNHIELSIKRTLLNLFWDGSNWVGDPNARIHVSVSGPNNYWSYQFNNQPPFGRFLIVAHAVDNAGNVENSATIEFDNNEIVTPPEPSETPTPTPTPTEMITPTPSVVSEPDFSVDLNHSTHHLSFTTTNFPDALIHYEVLYQNSVGQQGIVGDIPLSDLIGGVANRDFYLGTCSTGGTCVPDIISIGSSLSVNLNGQIKTVIY